MFAFSPYLLAVKPCVISSSPSFICSDASSCSLSVFLLMIYETNTVIYNTYCKCRNVLMWYMENKSLVSISVDYSILYMKPSI